MLSARSVLEALKACRVTFCVGLADTTLGALARLVEDDPSMRFVPVTREGEAFGAASGLWIGGQNAAVIIQNTGFLESGDALRGTAQRMRIPLLCLITYRGHSSLRGRGAPLPSGAWSPDDLSEPGLDSAALVTEPTLHAWGVPYEILDSDADLHKIPEAFGRAQRESRPVALLVTRTMDG
jgi:sulfopyruvate decarboxylase subunit alpha